MITKGVASVRSPVQNLQRFDPGITHERFVEATIEAFQDTYGIDEEVRITHTDGHRHINPSSSRDHLSHIASASLRYRLHM